MSVGVGGRGGSSFRETMTFLRFHASVKVLFANFTADDAETGVVRTLKAIQSYKL